MCVCVSLKVASQLLHATSGPVKAVEGSLNQWSHDAAHVHLIPTAVPLAIVLHTQPVAKGEKKKQHVGGEEEQETMQGKSHIKYWMR